MLDAKNSHEPPPFKQRVATSKKSLKKDTCGKQTNKKTAETKYKNNICATKFEKSFEKNIFILFLF